MCQTKYDFGILQRLRSGKAFLLRELSDVRLQVAREVLRRLDAPLDSLGRDSGDVNRGGFIQAEQDRPGARQRWYESAHEDRDLLQAGRSPQENPSSGLAMSCRRSKGSDAHDRADVERAVT